MRRRTAVVAVAGAAVLAWGEFTNWRWSRTSLGDGTVPSGDGTEAVVVLGFRNPGTTANIINRWRVRAGIRSATAGATRVVLSGGATSGGASEAQLMADYAKSVLAYDGTLILEEESTSTWENITNVVPLIEDADRIKLVSQPAHALKARVYLRRRRPDLAARLVRADDYRPGEWLLAKPLLAAYGLWKLRGLDTAELETP